MVDHTSQLMSRCGDGFWSARDGAGIRVEVRDPNLAAAAMCAGEQEPLAVR